MPDQGPSASGSGKRGGSARSSTRGTAGSARKAAGASSRWSKSSGGDGGGRTGPANFSGGRSIVFMVGGAAYSEVRAAREVSKATSREIVIGSTAFVSPNEFIEELALLGDEEA